MTFRARPILSLDLRGVRHDLVLTTICSLYKLLIGSHYPLPKDFNRQACAQE